MDVSGENADVSGNVMDVSGDVSGNVVDVSGADVSGNVVDVSGAHIGPDPSTMPPTFPIQRDVLSLDDILSDVQIVTTKEEQDRSVIESISTQSVVALKPRLVEWAMRGFPNAYPILTLNIQPPAQCSDGETRSLQDYVTYCSGKTIEEHVGILQGKLQNIHVSFANLGGAIAVVVSRG